MLCGSAGTGKTQNVTGTLKKLSSSNSTSNTTFTTINFNFYTTASILQQTMSSSLEKKTGCTYGPPSKTNLVYFVDDLTAGRGEFGAGRWNFSTSKNKGE
jgi:dynein heavy chain